MKNSLYDGHQASLGPSAVVIYCIFLIICFTLSVTFRLPYLSSEMMGSDEALYAWCAQRIAVNPFSIFSGEVLEFHPLLFPISLMLGSHIFQPSDAGYRGFMLLLSIIGMGFVYVLSIRLHGKFLGLFAVVILTFNYPYLLNSTMIMADLPSFVFCALLLWVLTYIRPDSMTWKDALVGVLTTILFLLRWSNAIFIPVNSLGFFLVKEVRRSVFQKNNNHFIVPVVKIFARP